MESGLTTRATPRASPATPSRPFPAARIETTKSRISSPSCCPNRIASCQGQNVAPNTSPAAIHPQRCPAGASRRTRIATASTQSA